MDKDTNPQDVAGGERAPVVTEAPESAPQSASERKQALLDAMDAAAKAPQSSAEQTDPFSQGNNAIDNSDFLEDDGRLSGDEGEREAVQSDEGDEGPGDEVAEGKQPSKNFRGRWDHLDEPSRRVIEMTTKHGMALNEAMALVYGGESTKAFTSAGPEKGETQIEAKPDPVAEIDTQLAAKQAEIDALEDTMDEMGFERDARADRKRHRELVLELSELKAERRYAERQKTREAETAAASEQEMWDKSFNDFSAKALNAFPDIQDEGSELAEAINAEFAYLQASGSPILQRPDFPYLVARRVAQQLGLRPAAASGNQGSESRFAPATSRPTQTLLAALAPQARQQASRARPVPTGGSPVAPPSIEDLVRGAKTKKEMLDLMSELGTPLVG